MTVLADGEAGHVEARSSQNMPRYWNNPEATEEAVRPGRWIRTGDYGRLEGGLLFILTRDA